VHGSLQISLLRLTITMPEVHETTPDVKGVKTPVFEGDYDSFKSWRRRFVGYVRVVLKKPTWFQKGAVLSKQESEDFYSILSLVLTGKAEKFVSRKEHTCNGADVWRALNAFYDDNTMLALIKLEDEFYEMAMKEDGDPGQFLLDADEYFQKYDNISGTTTENDRRIAKAISRMPEKWKNLSAERFTKGVSVDMFAITLTNIYKMSSLGVTTEKALIARGSTGPKKGKCYNCGKEGHYSRECKELVRCHNCGMLGHKKSDCKEKKKESGTNDKCEFCGEVGHTKYKCLVRKEVIQALDKSRVLSVNKGTSVETYTLCADVSDALKLVNEDVGLNWDDYRLRDDVFKRVCEVLDWEVTFDLCASSTSKKASKYFGKKGDCFKQDWRELGCEKVYANLPFHLIDEAVKKGKEESAKMLMVLPLWTGKEWFWSILPHVVGPIIMLEEKDGSKLFSNVEMEKRGVKETIRSWGCIAAIVDFGKVGDKATAAEEKSVEMKGLKKNHVWSTVLRRPVWDMNETGGREHGSLAFCVDSGATSWMMAEKSGLQNYRKTNARIRIGDGTEMKGVGEGRMRGAIRTAEGTKIDLDVDRVLHVPGLEKNLAPVRELAKEGRKVVFGEEKDVMVLKNGREVELPRIDGLNYLDVTEGEDRKAYLATSQKKEILHERLSPAEG